MPNLLKFINPVFLRLLVILLVPLPIIGEEMLKGWVVSVQDGDSVTVLMAGNRQIRVRLAQIDAPEFDQVFGQQSRQSLTDMVLNKNVLVLTETVDKDGRIVGTIYSNRLDVNREQIKRGMAWAYRQYLHDDSLLDVERQARRTGVGLWAEPRPMPPWRYRHGGRNVTELNRPSPAEDLTRPLGNPSCGNKRFCKDMISCEEARVYLNQCGLSRLDSDHDGVPCESLCGGKK